MPSLSPVETKVAAGGATTLITGAITYILVTFVPSFHSVVPGNLQGLLTFLVPTILGLLAAYNAKHTTRPNEVMDAALKLLEGAGVQLPAKM
jgi:hypothetical protein